MQGLETPDMRPLIGSSSSIPLHPCLFIRDSLMLLYECPDLHVLIARGRLKSAINNYQFESHIFELIDIELSKVWEKWFRYLH